MKYQPKTPLFKHQSRGVVRAVRKKNYAFFFEPRCGKSKAAIDTAAVHALRGDVNRVLILTPAIGIDVWKRELRKHLSLRAHVEDYDEEWNLRGDPPSLNFFLAGREETFRRTKHGRTKQKKIEKWNPDLIVVDESHEYKRPGGRGAQDLWRLVRRLRKKRRSTGQPWVILMTGTPGGKGYMDLFAQFRIMDERLLGTNASKFQARHVVYGHGKRRWTILKYKNTARLEKIVRAHSLSVSAEAAGLANETFFELLKVELPPAVKKMYLELAEEFIVEWKGGVIDAANAGVKRIRLLQLTGGFTTDGRQIHHAKVEALLAYSKILLEQGESLVVYSRFTPEVGACVRALEQVGYRTFRVDGSVSRADRREAIESLRKRPATPTAIAFQHQAGSRAIELVGAAETVYFSAPDGWIDYWQTVKRTQGPNQKRALRYTHLVAKGTLDIPVIRALQRKEDWHQTIMRNPRRYLGSMIQ